MKAFTAERQRPMRGGPEETEAERVAATVFGAKPEKVPATISGAEMGAGTVSSFNARAIAGPRPAALQHNGGRTPSAWGGFQRRSLFGFGASVAQRIGKIAAAWLGAWKFLRSRP